MCIYTHSIYSLCKHKMYQHPRYIQNKDKHKYIINTFFKLDCSDVFTAIPTSSITDIGAHMYDQHLKSKTIKYIYIVITFSIATLRREAQRILPSSLNSVTPHHWCSGSALWHPQVPQGYTCQCSKHAVLGSNYLNKQLMLNLFKVTNDGVTAA